MDRESWCAAVSGVTKLKSKSEVAQSCPTLGDPTDCSTPGLPVHQQLLELAQTPVHRVLDAIQPSHPLIRFLCLSIPYSPLQVGGSGYLPEAGHYVWLQ